MHTEVNILAVTVTEPLCLKVGQAEERRGYFRMSTEKKTKRAPLKGTQLISTVATGGGGLAFQARVGALYLANMLTGVPSAFCSGLMKPDTHLGENARQIEVSDDQTTPYL
ncbi:hypothetical protein, partial [Pseudomonas savastanoi]|uniref:hypothetical protein n=1 Tax=Pseudomonas savastanoi TaxID=29438 RepID=UPI001969FC55